jgi:DNA modification methylase
MNDISGVGWRVMVGSCLDRLKDLGDESVDSVVCDPPYELGFMGKSWDSSGIAYNVDVWRECLRVLKPGGHVLAFGGSRTWHRLAVAVEDAGFELRDSIAWIYGSGFPKSLDVSKAIDKAAGAEREIVGQNVYATRRPRAVPGEVMDTGLGDNHDITAPATPEAQKWQGWGTALKPAFEPVVVGRKPLVGTVAANVLAYGVGGLNIDATRIGTEGGGTNCDKRDQSGNCLGHDGSGKFSRTVHAKEVSAAQGRWPANVMLDEYTAGLLDEQSGFSKSSGVINRWTDGAKPFGNGAGGAYESVQGVADSGGASRFFYVAKASKRDRNEGLDGLQAASAADMVQREEGSAGMNSPRAGAGRTSGAKNFHPTVKPTDLMRQLVRLVTPPGGIVLDPFTGSGSTGKAAILEGFQFIGVELTEEYLPIIQGRIDWAVHQVEVEAAKQDKALF